jgi:coenzyme F420-0:L-glutamate ligase/coenzyme F420-1:gamma-L-glutamate ligase
MAIVDELSGAAELVKGKCDQVPVAVVRGYLTEAAPREDGPGATVLVRDAANDLFSLGTAEARAAGLTTAAALSDVNAFGEASVARETVDRAVDRAALTATTQVEVTAVGAALPGLPAGTAFTINLRTADDPPRADSDLARLVALGSDVQRLRSALAADGLVTVWLHPADGDAAAFVAGPGPSEQTLAVGSPIR